MADPPVDYFAKVQANPGWQGILESFARFVGPAPGQWVLDVGSGPGALLGILREQFQAQAVGADADFAMMLHARQQYLAPVMQARLPHLPCAAGSFDVVTATNVLYLLAEPLPALHECLRVLKPGGLFAMLNPSPAMNPTSAAALADARHLEGFARQNFLHWGEVAQANFRWSAADISALFAEAGLGPPQVEAKIGPGLALYAKGQKV